MNETTALTVVPAIPEKENATALMRQATDVAGVCREIVMRTAMELQGKKYVKVEGWQSIAAAYGCIPSIREVMEEERGIKAIAELRRHDGTILATAEGYCGLDEPRWANQPLYARRGMAQTRAVSRVCRSAFAFVVVLIDSSLQTTPAEEIPYGDATPTAPTPATQSATRGPTSAKPRTVGERTKRTQVRFGKDKGKYLCDIDDAGLKWQLAAANKSVEANDPKWGEANLVWANTVEEEVANRSNP